MLYNYSFLATENFSSIVSLNEVRYIDNLKVDCSGKSPMYIIV